VFWSGGEKRCGLFWTDFESWIGVVCGEVEYLVTRNETMWLGMLARSALE
jgi:hypothetical protein